MTEHVVALDLGVTWEPNVPAAILLCDDYGKTVLALNPHHEDPDRRSVAWSGQAAATPAWRIRTTRRSADIALTRAD
jgi:hypothetical protein